MVNRKCPYCGGEHMSADCVICISGILQEDGTIKVNPWWDLKGLEEEAIAGAPEEDIHGFCPDCGSDCGFSREKGFIKDDV